MTSRLAVLLLVLPAALTAQRINPRLGQPLTLAPALVGPAGVQVIAAFPTTAMISFQPVSGATGYTLLRATSQAGPYTPVTVGVTNPSPTVFKDHGIDPGTTVWYQVAATYLNGQGVSAPVQAVTPQPVNPTIIQALQTEPGITTTVLPPTQVQGNLSKMWAIATTPGEVSLTWTPVPGADFYYVQWENNGLQVVQTPLANVRFPEPGSHTFSVTAYYRNEARGVNYSNTATPGKLTYQLGAIGKTYVTPEVYYGRRGLRINWSSAPAMTNMQVFRTDVGSQNFRKPTGGAIYASLYEERDGKWDGVDWGKTYTYRVLGTGPDGKQWFSAPIQVTIPPAAAAWTGFVGQSTAPGVVELTWTAPANVVSYDIWYGEQGYRNGPLVSLPGTATSYTHKGNIYTGYVYEYTLFANLSNATGPRQIVAVKIK